MTFERHSSYVITSLSKILQDCINTTIKHMTESLSLLSSHIVTVFLELNCFPKSWQGVLRIWQITLSSKLPRYWQHGHDGCWQFTNPYFKQVVQILSLNNCRYTFAAVYI